MRVRVYLSPAMCMVMSLCVWSFVLDVFAHLYVPVHFSSCVYRSVALYYSVRWRLCFVWELVYMYVTP